MGSLLLDSLNIVQREMQINEFLAAAVLAALELIEVHGPNGSIAYVNVHEISSLREPSEADIGRHFAAGTHCVVVTTNGKFLAVRETCAVLRDRLSLPPPPLLPGR